MSGKPEDKKLLKYLSPLGAWALAFGCAVGWGAFVMPGTTFLPTAGPLGTVIGILAGALIMLIIGANYHFLINTYPDSGGTYTYTKKAFGYDHGFLSGWFLILTYVAIIWANASALPLIARNLFGDLFKTGFHYQLFGFDIYFGEVCLAVGALALGALLCTSLNVSSRLQSIMALVLIAGITVCFAAVMGSKAGTPGLLTPSFPPDKHPGAGIFTIIALAPWAYVGFESISHSAGEFKFPVKKTFRILVISVIAACVAYTMLAVLAAAVLPGDASSWVDYISNLGNYPGIEGLPTFFAARSVMGTFGYVALGITTLAAILTGLLGNYIASSRLLFALTEDDILPEWFGRLNKHHVPGNAILFLFLASLPIPFFGRTAISWVVDVTTVGATIAYAYTSAAALRAARENGNKLITISGAVGLAVSCLFILYFLIPHLIDVTVLSTESYLILAAWGILGFLFFQFAFRRDKNRRLGRSTVAWVVLLALIIFTSTVWMRQTVEQTTLASIKPVQDFYVEQLEKAGVKASEIDTNTINLFVKEHLDVIGEALKNRSLVQTFLIIISLAVLFYIYFLMQKREKQIEVEKVLAEESSRAKTSFLSNMSHEIRTPMNAIIGLDNIALKDPNLTPHTREQLEKIGTSAKHLLGLINDILDMSRIESGRMVLKNEEFSFRDFLDQINVMINGQCSDKGLNFECHIIGRVNDYYIGDDLKLKQVLINILGNAVKFTPVPGSITFTVEQTQQFEGYCTLRFIIKDTGIGMSKEYLPKIFDAFSQETTGTSNKYGSTGLGMAITKNIVGMMNGDIFVESEKGVGSTFTVTVTLNASSRSFREDHHSVLPKDLRVLIVDDDAVASEHALVVCNAIGISPDLSSSGQDAIAKIVKQREEGIPYQVILTDYKMPGMNGLDLTRTVRRFDHGETAIIILTGYSWEEIQDECKASGVDSILSKPLFTDTLLRGILHTLRLKGYISSDEAEEDREDDVDSSTGSLAGLHVLIAEDMEINAEILIDLLDMEGITSELAENGELAVELFSSHPEGHFDAIFMDMRMPVMDGLEATRAIRSLDRTDARTIPIIAMTANAFDEDVQRSLQAGLNAHLSKPVEPERMYETLEKLIHPHHPSDHSTAQA